MQLNQRVSHSLYGLTQGKESSKVKSHFRSRNQKPIGDRNRSNCRVSNSSHDCHHILMSAITTRVGFDGFIYYHAVASNQLFGRPWHHLRALVRGRAACKRNGVELTLVILPNLGWVTPKAWAHVLLTLC